MNQFKTLKIKHNKTYKYSFVFNYLDCNSASNVYLSSLQKISVSHSEKFGNFFYWFWSQENEVYIKKCVKNVVLIDMLVNVILHTYHIFERVRDTLIVWIGVYFKEFNSVY